MTVLVTWNIQSCRGTDGRVDPDRIAEVLHEMGPADVICLQEVARFCPDLDGAGADQVRLLADRIAGYEVQFGAAWSRRAPDEPVRREMGNMILSRLPVIQVFAHPLPQPPAPGVMHMPRQALEVVVEAGGEPLRVITTHLEYHSSHQRHAQIDRLRALHREAAADLRQPGRDVEGPYARWPRPDSVVICGDFNILPGSDEYRQMLAGFDDGTPAFTDAWTIARPGDAHPPTTGVFDRDQWPEGPHCRDYFFVSEVLSARIAGVTVNTATDASDHQPLRLDLY